MSIDGFRGYISIEHTVWCGVCGNWDQRSGKKRRLIKQWLAAGWKRERARGWVCPKCQKKTG
jgi:hypothetical protein